MTAADDMLQQKRASYQTQLVTEEAKHEWAVTPLRYDLIQPRGLASKQNTDFMVRASTLSANLVYIISRLVKAAL